jgi:hypothetical protein
MPSRDCTELIEVAVASTEASTGSRLTSAATVSMNWFIASSE